MRPLFNALLLSFLTINSSTVIAVTSSMAQTGFTGILRIPHAEALPFGKLSINYQWEENINYETCYACGAHKTILMGVGLLPGLEFTVQNAHKQISDGPGWGSGHSSDLSFSAKYDFKPFLPEEWFSFAVGVQDYGGAASHHKNAYAVASKSLFPETFYHFRLTAGYGQGDAGNQMGSGYLQGTFAGIEWQPLPWLQLLAEHDGTGINSGIKLLSDDQWLPYGWKANVTYQLYSDSITKNRDNQWLGFGLTWPLVIGEAADRYSVAGVKESASNDERKRAEVTKKAGNENKKVTKEVANIPSVAVLSEKTLQKNEAQQLLTTLVEYGFENVQVGWLNQTIVVVLENNLFNWNELDGIGVALGLIMDNSDAETFQLQLLNNQISVVKVQGDSQQYRKFLNQNSEALVVNHGLLISNQPIENSKVKWSSEREASSHFVPRFIFSPHLRSAMGTEFGVFDYSLALSSNIQMSLWKGGVVDVRHLLPITHSDSYDDGQYFENGRHVSEVDRILFHQAFGLPASFTTQFSGGQIYKNYLGVLNETYWQSPEGDHRFKTEVADFKHKDTDYSYQPLLVSYRYYLRPLDLAIEGVYGQHWAGDLGASLSLKQWFGDMAVKLTYQNTTCDRSKTQYSCARDGYAENHEYAGLNFIFPFGTRKNASPSIGFQVKTLEQWAFGYRSRINHHANYIGGNRSSKTNLQYNIEQQYYNRDRLSATYIHSHAQRLRESYLKYIK
ncbi:YjbH domain-containing protein [Psychromonas hadalis]|uniref:YjbH domain-containing protein n=1 Tax=Psychromonas hadalis TaxID=211669 RepID=UPI0003B657CB|nr:YjbH domain-containing protein [Psychromonas hadalis]